MTDEDVRLGLLYAPRFAGGELELDPGAVDRVLQDGIGGPMDLDLDMAAFGLAEVVDENMAAAARAHAAEFGLDLGERDLLAVGGAAPVHAASLGEKLGVRRIVRPTEAGVGSAVGFLLAPVAYEVVRSRHQALSGLQADLVNRLMVDMRSEALDVVQQGVAHSGGASRLDEARHAYMRYRGQGHEIPVELPVEEYGRDHAQQFRSLFEQAYARLYGRTIEGVDIEVLSWTLTITAALPERGAGPGDPVAERPPPAPARHQEMFDPGLARRVDAPVYEREALLPGDCFPGPALITEDQTTTVITSHYDGCMDRYGYIVMTRKDHRVGADES